MPTYSILAVEGQSNNDLDGLVQLKALKCIFEPFTEKFTDGMIVFVNSYLTKQKQTDTI